MNDAQIRAVCATFDLGSLLTAPRPVPGGLTHRLWRLMTDRGEFAVKEMDRAAERPDAVERGFALEQAAAAARISMPMPIPVAATGRCLAEVPSDAGLPLLVRVHEWVDGVPLTNAVVQPVEVTALAAQTLARIHALRMACEPASPGARQIFGDGHWRSLVERAEQRSAAWSADLRRLLPVIAELESYLAESQCQRDSIILGHRDSDPKNHMRTASGALLLVDWDAAGPVVARHEVANQALVWAGLHLAEPVREYVHAYIDAYRRAGGDEGAFRHGDLAELVGARLKWFEFNLRRALDDRREHDAGRRAGESVLGRNVEQLPRFLRSLNGWLALLSR